MTQSNFITQTHTEKIEKIEKIEIIDMGLMIDSLRLKRLRPGARRSVSLRGESSFTKAGGEGTLSRVKSKGVWWGSLLLWNWRGGLDSYCSPKIRYLIDNKSFRRIVKAALTRFLTSLEMLEKDLENA